MRRLFVSAISAAALAGSLVAINPAPASAATCPSTFNNVTVTGGEASWSVACTGGTLYLDGWVRDTKADGKCAYVKAFIHGGREEAKACPKGTTTRFTWTQSVADYGNNADAYLYTA